MVKAGGPEMSALQLTWAARRPRAPVAGPLAYVCTAFLVACDNASLVGILIGARLGFPACRSLAGSPNASAWPPWQGVQAIQRLPFARRKPADLHFTPLSRTRIWRAVPAYQEGGASETYATKLN